MLPLDRYRPGTYPPGPQWAQWGDRYLDRAFRGISDEAHANLSQKRQGMMQFHKDRLDKQGLTPTSLQPDPSNVPREPIAWPDELYDQVNEPPPPPPEEPPSGFMQAVSGAAGQAASMLGRGATEAATQTAAAYLGGGPLVSTIASGATEILAPVATNAIVGGARAVKNLVVQRGTAASYNPPSTTEQGTQMDAPQKKQLSYSRGSTTYIPPTGVDAGTQATVPGVMEEDQGDLATQYYGSDTEVDDAEMQNRIGKRSNALKTERKVKIKVEPPVKQEPAKVKIKLENELPTASSSSSSRAPPPPADDEDLQTLAVNFSNNTDMKFWEDASGNEIKSQLNLRFPEKSGDWDYKSRAQLISIVRGLIRKKQWVQGVPVATEAPSRTSRGRSRSPLVNAAPAIDPNDDDIQVGALTWDTNQDPEYWAQQSANYIRENLTRRFPTLRERTKFAFFKKRQEYIDYITDLIRQGKW